MSAWTHPTRQDREVDGRVTVLPPRENYAGTGFVRAATYPVGLPQHLIGCADPAHDGVCEECGCWISIGPTSGIEYGHARANNRDPETRRELGDCRHRPPGVDPIRNQGGLEDSIND